MENRLRYPLTKQDNYSLICLNLNWNRLGDLKKFFFLTEPKLSLKMLLSNQ